MRESPDCCTDGRMVRLLVGLIVLALGIAFLLHQADLVELDVLFEWWPLALVAIGLVQVAGGRRFGGFLWILAGGWILLWQLDVLDASPWELFWPVVLAIVGSVLVYQSLVSPGAGGDPEERFTLGALWSGNVVRLRTPTFRGGSATAIMGGCEIDLRHAEMLPGKAVIHVVALWGGVEIHVPEHWRIEDGLVPVLGGTSVPANPLAEPDRRLVIRGLAVMGGVEVTN